MVTMDKCGANRGALDQLNVERDIPIKVRQVKYLNNIVEQDHRAVKRVTPPMLGFKSFRAAQAVLAGIELIHPKTNEETKSRTQTRRLIHRRGVIYAQTGWVIFR